MSGVGIINLNNSFIKGEILHKPLQPFFEAVNKAPLKVTKAIWGLTPVIQAIGLVNKNAEKLAKALYGTCWSIVYTCYRPWATDRKALPEVDKDGKTITDFWKTVFNTNEHFRLGMGTLVSAVYGGGAIGMLYSWFKGDDDLFDRSADIYQIGMFNQNQIFDSMNFTEVLKREFISSENLEPSERSKENAKAKIEKIDSCLFIPNIITRVMDTCRLFGTEFNELTQRIINVFSYVGYGTWAMRLGLLKQTEGQGDKEKGVLLDPLNPTLKGTLKKADDILYDTQKYGAKIFYTVLPGLSWLAAMAESFGFREFAEKSFKLEGILERLNPAIGAWCVRNTWLRLFEKK